MKRYNSAEVIAETFSLDFAEMKELRYQAGRSDKPIYTIGGNYYCACKIGNKPSKHWTINFDWEKIDSAFADKIGWQVWESKIN